MIAMSQTEINVAIVEDELELSLADLCRACRTGEEQIRTWVVEGVLEPIGGSPREWRFAGPSLRRARLALTLTRELEVNPPGVALALDLLDEIDALRAALRRAGKG
jgi:chaperone modulatory protein CbpM